LQGYEVREYLLEKYDRKCVYCGVENVPLQVEHIIPVSRGGSYRVSNLTIACEKCNLKKDNKTAEEFNRKGYGRSIRKQRYQFQPNDFVRYKGQICRVKGMFNYGKWVRLEHGDLSIVNSNIKNVEIVKYGKGLRFN